jgi:uncharacterized protein YfkK (UPF0435 family)
VADDELEPAEMIAAAAELRRLSHIKEVREAQRILDERNAQRGGEEFDPPEMIAAAAELRRLSHIKEGREA